MKLLVSELGAYRTYVSREFFYVMDALIRFHGWKHVDARALCRPPGSLRQKLVSEFGEIPEVILFWEAYGTCCILIKELLDLPCRRCIFADDLHSWSEDAHLLKHGVLYLFDRVLATCEYALDDFFPGLRAQKDTVWIPHAASPDFLLPYNANPQNAVLLSGAINRYYPLRQSMKALYDRRQYPITFHPHPGYHSGYDYELDADVGPGYAIRINRHRAAFTDSSRYGYLVAKYFEIPATGALLLADLAARDHLTRLGFLEDVHYLSVSAGNLEEKVRDVLSANRRDDVDQIRRRGQELVWNDHKTSDRARLIDRACGRVAAGRANIR